MMSNEISPFFIIGNPRSGTTLLRLMLDTHPKLIVPPECGFMIWFFEKYGDCDFGIDGKNKIASFIEDLKSAKKVENWKLDFEDLKKKLFESSISNYRELIDRIYRYYADSYNKRIKQWGDKNNFYLTHIGKIKKIYPKAKFIWIIRDGRDVACSYRELNNKKIESKYAPKLKSSIIDIANEWVTNNEKIANSFNLNGNSEEFITLKYEDLVNNSKWELKRITDFLDIEFDQKMLDYYKSSDTYEPDEYLQWKANTKKAPQNNSIKRYLKDLNVLEIDQFNTVAYEFLNKFGYDI